MANVSTQSVTLEIESIFNANRVTDLKRFLEKRQCLNLSNMFFEYMFHIIQNSGIIITTIAAGYNEKYLVWVGAGISSLASLVKVFESSNNAMLKKLLNDIKAIKAGTYVDEGSLVDDGKVAEPPASQTPRVVVAQAVKKIQGSPEVTTRPAV